MRRHLTPRAVNRARWFAQLSAALDESDAILAELVAARFGADETERLRQQLRALRAELERLNRVDLKQARVMGRSWPADPPNESNRVCAIHPDWRPRRD